jgi:hypothetical protein
MEMNIRASLPNLVLATTGVYVSIALFNYTRWWATGDISCVISFFRGQGTFFFFAFNLIGLALSVMAWRHFSSDDVLKQAWLWIVLAAACHLTGRVFVSILGVNPSLVNEASPAIAWVGKDAAVAFYSAGSIIGGPMQMLSLACGLFIVVRVYKRLGLLARLTVYDYALLSIVVGYTLSFLFEISQARLRLPGPVTVTKAINWASNPLLSLLLLEAIFIRRSVANMGYGLIAKCWSAFTAAIFLTSIGNMGLWATGHKYLTLPYSSLTWGIWHFAMAAYALGPAYQVEALLRATSALKREISYPASR